MPDQIIVYRSRADQAIDNWLWSDDGLTFLLVFGISLLIVALIGLVVYGSKRSY